jgi:alkylation response protein AidB-like acyl-CoA dehydrogenase
MLDGHAVVADRPALDLAAALAVGFAARAGEHDRASSFPRENIAAARAAGLLGLTADPADGGGGAGLAETCAVTRALGRGCPSTALVLAMQFINVAMAWRGGRFPPDLARCIGRSAVADGALINVLRVEAGLGTPARGGLPATVARRTDAGWSITGHKTTATGAPGLTWMLVFARTDEADPRMGSFLVPAGAPGARIVESWDQLGLRASGSHDVVFDDVAIPAEHAADLRPPAEWARPDPLAAAWSMLPIGALYTGVAQAARDWLIGFLRDRVPTNLGAPLATLPRLQEAVGEIEALLLTNVRLVDAAAAAHDRGEAAGVGELGLIKTIAAENAIRAVQRAVEICGNPGLSRRNPLERHLRDVLCARIHTPQADAAHLAAGRAALGV